MRATLLGAAALLGRRFDWRLLPAMITSEDEAGVVTHLRRAAEAQLLSVEAGDGRFRFRHALTREAILAEAPAPGASFPRLEWSARGRAGASWVARRMENGVNSRPSLPSGRAASR